MEQLKNTFEITKKTYELPITKSWWIMFKDVPHKHAQQLDFLLLSILFSLAVHEPCTKTHQVTIAIVVEFGKLINFITITCNPQWPEIQRNLTSGEYASNRPDLYVFYLYLKEIERDIMERKVLGTVVSFV
jgi:Helitron helicase-like domain at N-terminus